MMVLLGLKVRTQAAKLRQQAAQPRVAWGGGVEKATCGCAACLCVLFNPTIPPATQAINIITRKIDTIITMFSNGPDPALPETPQQS